jgi:hypothetical protein
LLALGGDIPTGGPRLIAPGGIRLMADLVEKRIRDPKRIKQECAKLTRASPKLGGVVAPAS